ncbi:MAG: DNA-binding response regulator [Alphaproteobacteria bacterium]
MAKFFNVDEVDAKLEREFVEEVTDSMATLEVMLGNLRSNAVSVADSLATLKMMSHNLMMQSRLAGMPMMQIVTSKMADYVLGLHDIGPQQVDDIQSFADKISAIVAGDLTEAELDGGAKLVRELPAKRLLDVDFEVVIPKNVEVLAVLPERSLGHIVERELAACGLRSTTIRNPFEALEAVVRIKPDLIIAAMELGSLNGVDLACAFVSMPKTRMIPFALFTSYKFGHPALSALPVRAAILHKGPSFGSDLAEALARFGIT